MVWYLVSIAALQLSVLFAEGLIVAAPKPAISLAQIKSNSHSLSATSADSVVQSLQHGEQAETAVSSFNRRAESKRPHSNAQLLSKDRRLGWYERKIDEFLVRPNAGKGPDVVKFGVQLMNFYGANLNEHTFSVDMVMSVKWNDTRALKLLPHGADKFTMAWGQALKQIWMPGVVVTNRDIEKYEIISASVTVFRSGEVLRVERANARIMMKFQLQDYPFDTQHLQIKVASSKYMSDELLLVADEDEFGCHEHIFGLYKKRNFSASAYETSDGPLRKSRGMVEIQIERCLVKYFEDHLLPTLIIVTISCSVFYFPFANPFITARLCLSILALLQFTGLMVQSNKELPGSAPYNWNDLFNQVVQSLMFLTIVINIGSEILFHSFQFDDMAKQVNNEAKLFMPLICLINIGTILTAGLYHWMTLETATFLTKTVVFAMFVCFSFWISFGVHSHVKTIAKPEAAATEGEDDGDADADAGDGGDAGDC